MAKHDDPKYWDCPGDFSHWDAPEPFENFVAGLEVLLGRSLTTEGGGQIQNASFHSEIPFDGDRGRLRFSSFGNMIAFMPDVDVSDSIRGAVSSLAKQLGYVLVRTEILEEQYTGSNPGVTGIETWWIRYFDYV